MRILTALFILLAQMLYSQQTLNLIDLELIILSREPEKIVQHYGYQKYESNFEADKYISVFNDDKDNDESKHWIEYELYKDGRQFITYTATRTKIATLLSEILQSDLFLLKENKNPSTDKFELTLTSEEIGCSFTFYCNKNDDFNTVIIFNL